MLDKIKETAIKIKELLQTNDKRCQDLLDFIEWGILNLPEDFRNNFTSDNIMPPKHGQYYVEFNKKDYLWWKRYHVENPKIIIPPITKIKREVLDKVIKEYNDLVFDTANEDLSITLEDIKNIKV